MSQTVYFRGGRRAAVQTIRAFLAAITGHSHLHREAAEGVFFAIGFAALGDIQQDFVTKARGGVGEDGVKWAPLKPETIAYNRRFGPGEQTMLKLAAGLNRGHKYAPGGRYTAEHDISSTGHGGFIQNTGLMSLDQLRQWRKIYSSRLAQFAAYMPIAQAKAKAAAIAWTIMKQRGAKTKLEVFGKREVEILRDTGVLLNSLSQGYLWQNNYAKPSGEGGEDQIFRSLENGVVIGTKVPYAATHQFGSTKRKIPARPFFPRPDRIPSAWLQRWLSTGLRATASALRFTLTGSAA